MSNYSESSTIKKPEAGDVWVIGCNVFLIMKVDNTTVETLSNRFTYDTKCFLTKEFTKAAHYLGKSKANINDLFEVQDDD